MTDIRRIASGGQFEGKVGYCRAVVHDGLVYVAGTTAPGENIPSDVAGQCRAALAVIGDALREAGSGFDRVLRVTYILPDRRAFPACWPILAEMFGPAPPAATMIEAGLIEARYLIEIEVTAALNDGIGVIVQT